MESKLEEYRLHKRRQERYVHLKTLVRRMLALGSGAATCNDSEDHIVDVQEKPKDDVDSVKSDIPSSSEEEQVAATSATRANEAAMMDHHNDYIKYTLKMVYLLFWATCYVIAIELQFGIVFLMFSALLAIYFNTRTGPKPKHEVSAYSVFNKDFESIDGTLKAEQFEREIRYGSSSVR